MLTPLLQPPEPAFCQHPHTSCQHPHTSSQHTHTQTLRLTLARPFPRCAGCVERTTSSATSGPYTSTRAAETAEEGVAPGSLSSAATSNALIGGDEGGAIHIHERGRESGGRCRSGQFEERGKVKCPASAGEGGGTGERGRKCGGARVVSLRAVLGVRRSRMPCTTWRLCERRGGIGRYSGGRGRSGHLEECGKIKRPTRNGTRLGWGEGDWGIGASVARNAKGCALTSSAPYLLPHPHLISCWL